jgi:hypothetical protein
MPPTYDTITGSPQIDGVPYSTASALTGTEADLFNQSASFQDPPSCPAGVACMAIVQLTVSGSPGSNSSYVVMQTNLGAGAPWIDAAWCVSTNTANTTETFCLVVIPGSSNSFQQSRAVGTAPGSNGSNQMPMGGKIRFVGKTTLSGGSTPAVKATIVYELVGVR